MEPEFALLQLGVRFYDAEVGRFTQRDPLESEQVYAYVNGRVLVQTDSTGYMDDDLKKYYLCVGGCVARYAIPGVDVLTDVLKIGWPKGRPPSDWMRNPEYLKRLKIKASIPWKDWGSLGPRTWRLCKSILKYGTAILQLYDLLKCLYGCIKDNPGAMYL